MSTPQPTTLDDWPVDDSDESPAERFEGAVYRGATVATAEPDDLAADREHCQSCGAHVSAEFRRVCGDRRGVAHACIECVESQQQLGYLASGREVPRLTDAMGGQR